MASHKLRGRSRIQAAAPNPCPLVVIAAVPIFSTCILVAQMYWKIMQIRAANSEWDEWFKVPLLALSAEIHLLRKGLANFIEGRDPAEIRAEIEAFHRASIAS